MTKLEQRMKLADEAVELIGEFRAEAGIVGHNALREVNIKGEGKIIEIEDDFDGVIEYSLTDISSVFSSEMRGWGPCPAGFYEAIEDELKNLESDFKKYSKEEFKEYAGSLKYAEIRCEEIYKRLEKIEREAALLDD